MAGTKKTKRYKQNRMTGKVNFAEFPETVVALILHAPTIKVTDKSDVFRAAFREYMAAHNIPTPSRKQVIETLGEKWAKENDYRLEVEVTD